jgi:hypothetical protein
MKVFLMAAAMLITFASLHVFAVSSEEFRDTHEKVKSAANDGAGAAALYFDKELLAAGYKVYDKAQGNIAIAHVLKTNLGLTDDMYFKNPAALSGEKLSYTVYYFDETKVLTVYTDGVLKSSTDIVFPYVFEESLTGYKREITEPEIIVTANAGTFDFMPIFIKDPKLIRTSGYEHVGR